MDEYEYTTLSTAKVWLEEGWYTPEDLQKIIDLQAMQEKHVREIMQPIRKGKNGG
jgi:hypothetical protein